MPQYKKTQRTQSIITPPAVPTTIHSPISLLPVRAELSRKPLCSPPPGLVLLLLLWPLTSKSPCSDHSIKTAFISCRTQMTVVIIHLHSSAGSDHSVLKTSSSLFESQSCLSGPGSLPFTFCLGSAPSRAPWTSAHKQPDSSSSMPWLLHLNILTPLLSLILSPFWRARQALFYWSLSLRSSKACSFPRLSLDCKNNRYELLAP